MSFRDKLNSPAFGISVVVLFVAAAVMFIVKSSGGGFKGFGDILWVYNIDTEELSKMPKESAIAPVQLDDGTGYTAIVYRCGDGSSGEDQVAYLSKYTPQAVQALGEDGVINEANSWVVLNPARSELIATVEGAKQDQWVPATMGNTDRFLMVAKNSCGGRYRIQLP